MKNLRKTTLLSLILLMMAGTASSQFFRVYEYTTLDPSEKELVYWTSYIASSDHDYSSEMMLVVMECLHIQLNLNMV